MIIEADNKKQTSVDITKNSCFFGSNKSGYYDYKMFVYEKYGITELGIGFSKWYKLIDKIKR